MESLILFTKWIAAIIVVPAVVFGVMIGARWWKYPERSIKIGALGFSIALGEDKGD